MKKIAAQLDATLPRKINSSVTLWTVEFDGTALQAYYTDDDYGRPDDAHIVALWQFMQQEGCSGAWKPILDAGYGLHAEIEYVDAHGHATAATGVRASDCSAQPLVIVRPRSS